MPRGVVLRGVLLGAAFGLVVIPVIVAASFLRAGDTGLPLPVRLLLAPLAGTFGSGYAVLLPPVWFSALALGAALGAVAGLAVRMLR